MPRGVSTQIHGVVPVLDAPDDQQPIDMDQMQDGETSRHLDKLDGSNDFNSPNKIPELYQHRERAYDQFN